MFNEIINKRGLLAQLLKREIQNRYKGSSLGILWVVVTPLLMLGVYTFVFGYVFNSRWEKVSNGPIGIALTLFVGLSVFGIFSESLNRAPTVIAANPNYVKRVVFPLPIIPLSLVGAALFNAIICLGLVWITLALLGNLTLYKIIFSLAYLLPIFFTSVGGAWIIASLGVYIKDVVQVTPVVVSALLFLSPVFYPLSAVPAVVRTIYLYNPVVYSVEMVRSVLLFDGGGGGVLIYFANLLLSIIIMFLGLVWFNKTRKGFADVI